MGTAFRTCQNLTINRFLIWIFNFFWFAIICFCILSYRNLQTYYKIAHIYCWRGISLHPIQRNYIFQLKIKRTTSDEYSSMIHHHHCCRVWLDWLNEYPHHLVSFNNVWTYERVDEQRWGQLHSSMTIFVLSYKI